jgi:glycerophosphoryl diester phosphodiesterase
MDDFSVAGHRGSCRTIDECGPSENSIASILFAERFGATAVEIDVRFTGDGVPIVYHDPKFSSRLTRGRYCVGFIEDLTLAHIDANCRLRFGEPISTVEEALTAALEETSLQAIWLDVKEASDVPALAEITSGIHARAADLGRDFTVYIGCPSRDVYDALVALDQPDTPCLVELGLDETIAAGCEVWGPRYTLGPIRDEVERARAMGIQTIFWTVDGQEFVDLLLTESDPTGLLSNRPHLVFHRYQMIHGGLE